MQKQNAIFDCGGLERTNERALLLSFLGLSKRGPRFSFHPTLLLPLRLLHLRGIFREEEMPFSTIPRFDSLHFCRVRVGQFISHLRDFPFFFVVFSFFSSEKAINNNTLIILLIVSTKKPRSLHPTQVSRTSTSILPGNPWVVRISDTRSYLFSLLQHTSCCFSSACCSDLEAEEAGAMAEVEAAEAAAPFGSCSRPRPTGDSGPLEAAPPLENFKK